MYTIFLKRKWLGDTTRIPLEWTAVFWNKQKSASSKIVWRHSLHLPSFHSIYRFFLHLLFLKCFCYTIHWYGTQFQALVYKLRSWPVVIRIEHYRYMVVMSKTRAHNFRQPPREKLHPAEITSRESPPLPQCLTNVFAFHLHLAATAPSPLSSSMMEPMTFCHRSHWTLLVPPYARKAIFANKSGRLLTRIYLFTPSPPCSAVFSNKQTSSLPLRQRWPCSSSSYTSSNTAKTRQRKRPIFPP